MIDKEINIKVFDFGPVSNHVNENSEIPVEYRVGREAPGMRTMKSDVFLFGLLLLELITKKEFEYSFLYPAHRGKKNLVDEFKEVDPETASKITLLTYSCTESEPYNRPTMKDVLDVLTTAARMGVKGEKRKRAENEAEKAATFLA